MKGNNLLNLLVAGCSNKSRSLMKYLQIKFDNSVDGRSLVSKLIAARGCFGNIGDRLAATKKQSGKR